MAVLELEYAGVWRECLDGEEEIESKGFGDVVLLVTKLELKPIICLDMV
jgi:hypothetical protein